MRDADTRRPEVKNLTTMLGSMLSGIFTSAINNTMARQNAREAMDWQERMMDKQNQYNSPLNQLLMKKAAGVNPYANTDFVPSAGVSSVKADTIPMNDPLMYAKTFAEIENINAATNKTESETDKLLKEMSMLDLAYSRGLLEKEEYEKRLQMMFEAWEKANPYEVEIENTQSGTALNEAQTETEGDKQDNYKASTNFMNAQTLSEDSLREYRKDNIVAQTNSFNSSAQLAREQAEKTRREAEGVSIETQRELWLNTISDFFKLPIYGLPAELQNKAAEYYTDFLNGNKTYESTLEAFCSHVDRYIEKNGHIQVSGSMSRSKEAGINILGFKVNLGASGTNSSSY